MLIDIHSWTFFSLIISQFMIGGGLPPPDLLYRISTVRSVENTYLHVPNNYLKFHPPPPPQTPPHQKFLANVKFCILTLYTLVLK